MRRSEEVNELVTALSAFQGQIESTKKDAKAAITATREYKYSTLGSLWDAIREHLSKNGLSIVQGFEEVPIENLGRILRIETILFHKSGQFISSALDMTIVQITAQAIGSLVTYGRRYSLGAILGLSPDDDDDGVAAMPKTGEKATVSTRLQNTPKLPVRETQRQEAQTRERVKQEPVAEKSITEKLITGELMEDPEPPQENPPNKVSPFKKPETASKNNDADLIDETAWKFIKAQFPDNWATESQSDFEDWVRATLKENGLTPMKDLNKLTRAMGRTLLQVATYCGDRSVMEFSVPKDYVIPKPKSPVSS